MKTARVRQKMEILGRLWMAMARSGGVVEGVNTEQVIKR
jgi:hypothetical protein